MQVDSYSPWRLTGVYWEPEQSLWGEFWNKLHLLKSQSNLPQVCGGDLNEIMWTMEKKGGELRDQNIMLAFQDVMDYCGLVDLDYVGNDYGGQE